MLGQLLVEEIGNRTLTTVNHKSFNLIMHGMVKDHTILINRISEAHQPKIRVFF